MKKLFIALCFSGALLSANAQEKFVKKYNYVHKSTDAEDNFKSIDVTFVFNDNDSNDIVIYGLEKVRTFYKVSKIQKGKTEGGQEYQLVDYVDAENGMRVVFQVFSNACRIFIGDDYVEYQE